MIVACSENAQTGRSQFAVVPDDALLQMADQAWADPSTARVLSAGDATLGP